MEKTIIIQSNGVGAVGVLEEKILSLKESFLREGVEVLKKEKEQGILFLQTDSLKPPKLVIEIGKGVTIGVILMLISNLSSCEKEVHNVNISIIINNRELEVNLPEDKQKILEYYEDVYNNDVKQT